MPNSESRRRRAPRNRRWIGGRREMSRRNTVTKLQSLDPGDSYTVRLTHRWRGRTAEGIALFIMRSGNWLTTNWRPQTTHVGGSGQRLSWSSRNNELFFLPLPSPLSWEACHSAPCCVPWAHQISVHHPCRGTLLSDLRRVREKQGISQLYQELPVLCPLPGNWLERTAFTDCLKLTKTGRFLSLSTYACLGCPSAWVSALRVGGVKCHSHAFLPHTLN